MLGLDLDGTLLDRSGRPTEANLAALRRAREAGLVVIPCTGRSLSEAARLLRATPEFDVGVFVTGAAVTDIHRRRMLSRTELAPALAKRVVDALFDLPEAVLVFQDSTVVGHDYLVTGRGTLSANTQWWFEATGTTVHFQETVTEADLSHTLRVGLTATTARMREITAMLRRTIDEPLLIQHFQAVAEPDPESSVHVLEVFSPSVSKWRGLTWLAEQRGVGPESIACIGDEINDVAMLSASGCGIAMGNACEEARSVAKYVTRSHDESGVAHAIDQLLEGRWGVD